MSAATAAEAPPRQQSASAAGTAGSMRLWPLALLTVLAALLRLSTLGRQSLWFDEAFTPVHVLRSSLGATLHAVSQTENTPPLWYVLVWALSRGLGTGAVALRLLSALAGVATVPVAWAIARRLGGPRAAVVSAGIVAVNPLFVWYSQEARAYALFALLSGVAMLCFLRARQQPTYARLAQFGLAGSLALLTHYFAVFLLAPMVVWLALRLGPRVPVAFRSRPPLAPRHPLRPHAAAAPVHAWAALALVSLPVLTGAALTPLVAVQASHTGTTQWIGGWALSSRLQTIPQYYLTGYSGAPLGHFIELLVAFPALAGIGYGLWRGLPASERAGVKIALTLAACGALIPIALALVGIDYLAPRNLIAAMLPVSVLLALLIAPPRSGITGLLLAGAFGVGLLAVTLDVDRSARLQRGDWAGLASVLRSAAPQHALTTVHLGTAPLQYYLSGLHPLSSAATVRVREIDETGYPPLRRSAGSPPPGGFRLVERRDVKGLLVYRFVSRTPVTISAQALRQDAIAAAHTEVLVPSTR